MFKSLYPSRQLRRLAVAALGAVTLVSVCRGQLEATPSYDVPETLTLEAALEFALDHNFEILQAKQRIREQAGLIIEVRSQALPNLSVDGQYIELDPGLSETFGLYPPTTNRWGLSLNARQVLYAGGGVRAALAAQELVEDAALLELQSVIHEALLQTREGFYNVLLAKARIAVQEESVELLEEQLQNVRDRLAVGTVSNFEVLRAEVELANARPALITARNDYRLAIEELRQVLGFFITDGGDRAKTPEFVGELGYDPQQYVLDNAIEIAMEERAELRRLEKIYQAQEKGIKIARSDLLPELNFIGSYQLNKASASDSFDDALDGWTAGVEVNVPVFDGFQTRGRIIQAKAQTEQARLEFQQAALGVEVEVRRALSALQEAEELADASIQVVGQAEEALRLAEARYAAGEATQLDVMQARVSLTEARLNQAEAFYRFNVAEARFRRAVGIADPFVEPEE